MRRQLVLIASLLFAAGCLADNVGGSSSTRADSGTGGPAGGTGPFCAVAGIFQSKCTACHRMQGQAPNLEFAAAPSIVNAPSPTHAGLTLIVPNDTARSFLYRKVAGPLSADEGAMMPLGFQFTAEEIDAIAAWINAGADTTCSAAGDGGVAAPSRYHPENFALPEVHSPELKMGLQDCRTCHGGDLTGGAGPSCDSCHQAEWRTTCTYCHGGTETDEGAPPRDLSGETVREALSFRAHTSHVTESNHASYDCTQCHNKPTDVLTPQHIFDDDTPGTADVQFLNGLSPDGNYEGNGTCSNLYCHGNGRTNGSFDHTREADCNSCHGGPSTAGARLLSGVHRKHIEEGVRCTECHNATVDAAGTINNPMMHVNGTKDIVFQAAGMTRTGATCTGTCHMERHTNANWLDDDD